MYVCIYMYICVCVYTCIMKGLSLIYKIGEAIEVPKKNTKQTEIPAKEKQRY